MSLEMEKKRKVLFARLSTARIFLFLFFLQRAFLHRRPEIRASIGRLAFYETLYERGVFSPWLITIIVIIFVSEITDAAAAGKHIRAAIR